MTAALEYVSVVFVHPNGALTERSSNAGSIFRIIAFFGIARASVRSCRQLLEKRDEPEVFDIHVVIAKLARPIVHKILAGVSTPAGKS